MKIHLSNQSHGNLCFRYGNHDQVLENRYNFFQENKIVAKQTVVMKVEHKSKIYQVTQMDKFKGVENLDSAIVADALITDQLDLNLMLLTADCLPVSIFDSQNQVIGLVHLGWRSIDLDLLPKVFKKMKTEFGTDLSKLTINIGPSIGYKSYLHQSPIQLEDPKWRKFIYSNENFYQIDLKSYVTNQIKSVSKKIKISVSQEDTASSEKYFSHFRSKKTGLPEKRFATVLSI